MINCNRGISRIAYTLAALRGPELASAIIMMAGIIVIWGGAMLFAARLLLGV